MKADVEFSRLIAIEGITLDKTRTETIEATEEECAALAKRFDLRELSGFKATINIRRVNGNTAIRIDGVFEADTVQACVVSLRDVHGRVEGKFETYFTEEVSTPEQEIDIAFDEADNAPEMVHDGMIDLGEVAAQYLALDLEPYPRAPGVSLAAQLAVAGIEEKPNPFHVLRDLKDGSKTDK
jgi:uncharacterized metal-binding protein YceD (DUF177 family)